MAKSNKGLSKIFLGIVVILVVYFLFMKRPEPYDNPSPMLMSAPSLMMMDTSAPVLSSAPMMADSQQGIMGINENELDDYAPVDYTGEFMPIDDKSMCAMNSGVGLASSLLPYKEAKVENYGDFAPDDILKGQNFLDPRQQIGFPETLGGTMRNSNLQIRSEPPNPKQAFAWNNSTIVPDLMQRSLCT